MKSFGVDEGLVWKSTGVGFEGVVPPGTGVGFPTRFNGLLPLKVEPLTVVFFDFNFLFASFLSAIALSLASISAFICATDLPVRLLGSWGFSPCLVAGLEYLPVSLLKSVFWFNLPCCLFISLVEGCLLAPLFIASARAFWPWADCSAPLITSEGFWGFWLGLFLPDLDLNSVSLPPIFPDPAPFELRSNSPLLLLVYF